jgi:hypothetical protein
MKVGPSRLFVERIQGNVPHGKARSSQNVLMI